MTASVSEPEVSTLHGPLGRLLRSRKTAVVVVAIALASIGWCVGRSWPGGDPSGVRVEAGGLACDDAVWDFGAVDATGGLELSREFVLTNESEQTLRIRKVRSGCGCMIAEGYREQLPPGESTRVSTSVSVPPQPGRFRKEFVVELESSSPEVLPLYVVGEVATNASMYSIPSQIHFGEMTPGQTKERTLRLLRYDFTPVNVLEVTANHKAVQCSVDPVGAVDERSATIRVRLAGNGLPPEPFSAVITVRTDHEHFPTCVFQMSATTASPAKAARGSSQRCRTPSFMAGTPRHESATAPALRWSRAAKQSDMYLFTALRGRCITDATTWRWLASYP